MKEVLIKIIIIIHYLMIYFLIFGFLLPKEALIYHVIFFPISYLHWITNDDKCFLTDFEYKLKNIDSPYSQETTSPFMSRFFATHGIYLNDNNTYRLTMFLFISSWLISLYRYLIY